MLDTEIGNGRMTHDVVPMAVLPVLREAVRAAAGSRGQSMKAFMRNRGMSPRLLNRDRRKKGFARSTVAALAEATNHEKLQTWAESEIYWDEVAAVEEDAVEEVYDLTVEGTHNFVANDLIVHNSHAAAYSIVAYQTAYLKAHYPAEFMAAAMTNDMGNNDKLSVVLEEARSMGLEILPPSINRSERYFTVDDGAIRFGLAAVKGAGTSAIDAIVNNREENGPFDTIWELTRELDLRTAGKRTLESLAQAGAMDELEGHRAQLIEAVDAAVRYGQKVQADKAAGQNSLFGGDDFGASEMEPNLPRTEPWPKAKKLKSEHEVIGFYVSGHPLDEFRAEADAFATAHFGDTEAIEEIVQNAGGDGRSRGPVRTFCGIITEVNRHTTKSGKPIAFASIEDFTGQGELVCFSTVLDRIQPYLEVDNVVLVQGNVELRGGTVKVIAKDVMPMWKVRDQMVKSIVLNVDATQIQTEAMREFKQLCEANRGHCKLYFDIDAPELHQSQRVRSRSVVIDPTSEVMKEMKRLFGRENIRLQGEA
jgi:DNA polymerase-3 subunit alpha